MKKTLIKTLALAGIILTVGSFKVDASDLQALTFQVETQDFNYRNTGRNYTEYSNGTWTMEDNGRYVLQIAELGDWDYEFDNEEDFKKALATYTEYRSENPIVLDYSFGVTKVQVVSDDKVKLGHGDYYFELTDGASGLYKNGKYYFYPAAMGDWDLEFDRFEDFSNIVKTYITMNQEGWF